MPSRFICSCRPAAIVLALFAALFVAASARAQSSAQSIPGAQPPRLSPDGAWMFLAAQPPEVQNATPWIRPSNGQALVLKMATIRAALAAAPLEADVAAGLNPIILALPDPNGVLQHFSVSESPVMEPGLAAIFPDIKTYIGQGIDDPSAALRADVTPQGFHAQVLSPGGHWYIDPYNAGDDAHYTSYYKRQLKNTHSWHCLGAHEPLEAEPPSPIYTALATGPTLRTYRLAVAATVEYTAFHGGTVALGQAAIVTAVNRVNGVYEKDLAVRIVLVANNSSLVYTTAPDPYTNNDGSAMLGENQTNLTNVIGSANYDIGHVFSTASGGIAGLGVVCSSSNKARGTTGTSTPTGDPFYIDYVAHEMGHQFGGRHSFNGTGGNCSGNRSAAAAYEPGSGTTIMGYAGICDADDLQPNSDAYFHWISIQDIRNYVAGGGNACGTNSSTGNNAPSVAAVGVSGVTIPKGTPFTLTATGSDPNGDPLTYCWEERNLGAAQALSAADNGASPLTRSFSPTTSPVRTVPQLSKILAGTTDSSEKLPSVARTTYAWTVTARDNRAGGGGVERADVSFAVNATAGPFTVTAPSSAVSWAAGSTQTVTWNVAGTTANGVNTASVNVLLSTDGGQTFPITLASAVPNNGSATFVVPNNQTAAGRVKVAPVGNIYFNIAPGTVTVTPPVTGPILSGSGVNTIADTAGNGNSNGRIDPGETAISVSVGIANTGNQAATGITATLSSLTGTVTVPGNASSYANLNAGASGFNATPYVLNVSAAHPCGAPISLRLNISSAQISGTYDFSLSTGQPGGSVTQTYSYTGPAVAIPDNTGVPATATLSVSGVSGSITDLNFRFDGSSCSATAGSTTVGLDHTWVGDLIVTLTSPQGTSVVLANRPGASAGSGSNGNNFCQTVFDDSGASAIQSILNDGTGAPYTGAYAPANLLSAFNGQNANGNWTLTVSDNAGQDTGNIRAFSLIVSAPSAVCDPPSAGCTAPTITTNPTSQTVCAGNSVTFNAAASGSPAPTYQWRKGGVNIGGATGTSYTINPVNAGSAGTYDCVATNTCGGTATATTAGAVLTVNSAPSIGTQPTAQTACVGSPASFTIAASGTPAPTFQWRKNTVNIGGATGTTLSITSVSAGDAAGYDCVVTNSCGSATSNSVALTANTAPSFGTQPTAQTACVGSPAMFTVAVTGTPAPTLQWRKNTVNIGGATSPTLTIASVTAGDAASYDCVATNSCSTATSTPVALTVQAAPQITTAPTAQTACAGSPAAFTAAFSGTPAPALQWKHNNVDIGGATGATLNIAAVAAGDVGSYECVATNACGSITTIAVSLTVQTAPSIDTQPTDLTVCEGSPASLTVAAGGNPAPTYQWRRNTASIGGATDPKLAIPAATMADGASYDCVVTNVCGSVTSNAVTLTVQPGTAISQQPTSVATCTGGMAMFTVTASGSTPPTYQWRKDTIDIGGATSSSLTISPVGGGDVGSYDCIVTADCGIVTSSAAMLTINCPNAADVAGFGNTLGCDGQLTVDDLVVFLAQFFASNVAVADIIGPGGGPPDGQVTVDDLTRFLSLFFAGCP